MTAGAKTAIGASSPAIEAREVEGLAARAAAVAVVEAALATRGGLEEALSGPPFSKLDPRSRAFARAVAMTTLRRLGPIDRMLAARLKKPPPDGVITLLRIGAAQLFYMDAPAFAVLDTTVELASRQKDTRPFKGLVNAVLRALTRGDPPSDEAAILAPDWLLARWRAAYGEAAALRIAALIASEPANDLSFRDQADAIALAEALEARPLPGGSWRTDRRGDLAEWPGFQPGQWWVQDASAAMPARLLEAGPGQTVLDLCAAPGGKTLQLAATGASVVALDRSAGRLKRVSENLARLGLSAEVVAADAAAWGDTRTFDAVLLDAPCTATGTFRRHPDVLWATRPADIPALALAQAQLLNDAAERVAPGGRLVYCVCSLEPEEGESQIGPFLRRHPAFTLEPLTPGEAGAPGASIAAGALRVLPFHIDGGADGFFAARFRRAV